MTSTEEDKKILTRAGLLSSGFKPLISLEQIKEFNLNTCVEVAKKEYELGLLDSFFL